MAKPVAGCANDGTTAPPGVQGAGAPAEAGAEPPVAAADFYATRCPSQTTAAPGFPFPSVLKRDVPQDQQGDIPKAPVIPLQELAKALAAEEVNQTSPPEAIADRIAQNVHFYGSWFPEETKQQFERVHRRLAFMEAEAGPLLMGLERMYAPDADRFLEWLSIKLGRLEGQIQASHSIGEGTAAELGEIAGVAGMWREALSADQRQRAEGLFGRIATLISFKDFRWELHFMGHTFVEVLLSSRLFSLAGDAAPKRAAPADLLTEVFFARPPQEVLVALDEVNADSEELPAPVAARVWGFLTGRHVELYQKTAYWNFLSRFLDKNRGFVPDFLARTPQWISRLPEDGASGDSKVASAFYVYNVYEDLIQRDLLPKERRREVYLLLLRWRPPTDRAYEGIADADRLEEWIVGDYLKRASSGDERYSGMIDDVAKDLLRLRAPAWGREKTLALVRGSVPAEAAANLAVTTKVIDFLVFKSRDAARELLAALSDPQQRDYAGADEDPFWSELWSMFGGGLLAALFERPSQGVLYERMLKEIPERLVEFGMLDLLRQFYFEQHPYAPVYRLPPELRPAGAPLTFVSIDSFPDLRKAKHPDRSSVAVLETGQDRWLEGDDPSHGVGVTSIAAGGSLGLAPEANLAVISIEASAVENFPQEMLAALERTAVAAEAAPGVAVVGISMGIEVPNQFRDLVRGSPIFRRLVSVCERLHERGVAIVASSGNDGRAGLINMLGFVPHVTLVGSLDSHLTADRSDDTESSYTTRGDGANPVRFWAHADPVLFPLTEKRTAWMGQGGTSSAQPHFSGALLLLRAVNPRLSVDQCLSLLEATADPVAAREQDGPARRTKGKARKGLARVLDPMEALAIASLLPGSTYEGERSRAFVEALGVDAKAMKRTRIYRTLAARRLPPQ